MTFDFAALRETYERDGVVFLAQALSPEALVEACTAYEWSLAHPGPRASKIAQKTEGLFYQDLYNPGCFDAFRPMLETSPIPAICAALWGTPDVWFMYEQVFLKEGGEARRTPWHQDASYLTVAGPDLAVAWITFDALRKEDSLEFIPGSHKRTLFDGSRFDVEDDTAPLYSGEDLPRLPDIEAHRGDFEIVSWPIEPGDLVIFHTHTLHGGAPTRAGLRRRTLTLRFFGERCVYDTRPGRAGPATASVHQRLRSGDIFRDDAFPHLLPKVA